MKYIRKCVTRTVGLLILACGVAYMLVVMFYPYDLTVTDYMLTTRYAIIFKLSNGMALLCVLGFCIVCIWAEEELYHKWDRMSWYAMNAFIIGLIYMVMQEGQIGWFIYEGIVLSIKNLSI